MPRGDGTGPEGRGPMTGRGIGRCGGNKNRTPNAGQPTVRGLGRRMTEGFNNIRQRIRRRRNLRSMDGRTKREGRLQQKRQNVNNIEEVNNYASRR